MTFLVQATAYAGTSNIGSTCEFFVTPCDLYPNELTIELPGLPQSVGNETLHLAWEATALPSSSPYCPITCTTVNTHHDFYTLLATPKAPETEPYYEILDYACDWASGTSDAGSVCTDILTNGFNDHYTWKLDCHRLSSDFVRLVTSLGISASQHIWASKGGTIGNMSNQRTKSFDPVDPEHGLGAQDWSWHQWSEAASYQRDPSANSSKYGSWGGYEDDLFTNYERVIGYWNYEWVSNQSGQSSGCESSTNRTYSSSPTLWDWRGPDR